VQSSRWADEWPPYNLHAGKFHEQQCGREDVAQQQRWIQRCDDQPAAILAELQIIELRLDLGDARVPCDRQSVGGTHQDGEVDVLVQEVTEGQLSAVSDLREYIVETDDHQVPVHQGDGLDRRLPGFRIARFERGGLELCMKYILGEPP